MEFLIAVLITCLTTVGLIYILNLVSKAITGVVLKIKNKKNKK